MTNVTGGVLESGALEVDGQEGFEDLLVGEHVGPGVAGDRVAFLNTAPICGLAFELIEGKRGWFNVLSSRLVMEVGVLMGMGRRLGCSAEAQRIQRDEWEVSLNARFFASVT